ncbi:aldo/keto reductase [Actinoplanes sp. NBRC 103695]|uniref:aldo/keto reductase n=1 Tax=Actinoplanes sp. NBRC 103695 TaxID=3032202 RepID=UPI002556DA18|nr:aldo/keto reductase [Actinoplanes sp. NBRC 103695]
MDHTRLGATGLEVSRLCLGTMTFGREIGEADSHRLLDRFVAAGGTFIDTADGYSEGRSEEIVGSWLKGRDRQDLVVGTKVRFGSGPNRRGLSRKHLLDAVDASLRRLGTDYVDLYQLHMWDYGTPLEETLRALDTIVRSGRVRYLGVSNVSGAQLQRGVDLCRAAGWEPLVSLQPLYNLLDRDAEWELIPVCLAEGLGVLPYSPLRGGWLTGKIRRGAEPPAATRIAATAPRIAAADSRIAATAPRIAAADSRIAATAPRIAAADSRIAATAPRIAAADSRIAATAPRIAATDSRVAATDQSGEATDRPGEPTWTEAWANYANDDRTWNVVDELVAVADEIGRTPAQTALNWLLHQPGVTAPIIGARTMEQLDDNLGAAAFTLDPAQLDRLDRVSDKPKPYPYQLLADLRAV